MANPWLEKMKVVRWPDGFMTDYEDFDYERYYGWKSDDYEIVEISLAEWNAYFG